MRAGIRVSDQDEQPERKRLELAYGQVCTSFDAITDFRGKLLTLLPLGTAAGVLVLDREKSKFLGLLGLFGAVAAAGLYMYEFRGMQRCHRLEDQAKTLERELGLSPAEGQFLGQPRRLFDNMLGPPAAGLVIYLAVVFAWLSVAAIGFAGWHEPPGKPLPSWLPWALVGLGAGYVVLLGVAWWFVHRRLRKWAAGSDEDLVRRGYRALTSAAQGRSNGAWHPMWSGTWRAGTGAPATIMVARRSAIF